MKITRTGWILIGVALVIIGIVVYRRRYAPKTASRLSMDGLTDQFGVTADVVNGRYYVNGREAIKCCHCRNCSDCSCCGWHWSESGSCTDPGCGCSGSMSQTITTPTPLFHLQPVQTPNNSVPSGTTGSGTASLSNLATGMK